MGRDMKLTWVLRIAVFLAVVMLSAVGVGFLDAIIEHVLNQWLEFTAPKPIESIFFGAMLCSAVWSWLCRKVWVGSQARF